MSESIPPFNKIDKLSLKIFGYDLASIFKPDGWRKYILFFVIVSGLAWIFFGYEGMFDQIEGGIKLFPLFLSGQKTFSELINGFSYRYGIGTHFSAAVIYGIMFYVISHYYEKINIKGSLNLAMSFLLTAWSVSIFEYTWMASYYIAQQQFWVLTPLTRQASILYQNLIFMIGGVFLILLIVGSQHQTKTRQLHFRVNKKLGFLLLLSFLLLAGWYFYPLPTPQLVVNTTGEGIIIPRTQLTGWIGNTWYSYPNFPQTMYTININPTPVGYGTPFFVEDNLVHTINTLMKVIWAYTVFYFGKIIFTGGRKEHA